MLTIGSVQAVTLASGLLTLTPGKYLYIVSPESGGVDTLLGISVPPVDGTIIFLYAADLDLINIPAGNASGGATQVVAADGRATVLDELKTLAFFYEVGGPDGWYQIGEPFGGLANVDNKGMAAEATSADGDEACATGLAATPKGAVCVLLNGIQIVLGGDLTKSCYFSGDAGATAKPLGTAEVGDKLYWLGSVAGFQLASTDQLDFNYNS